VEEWFPEKLQAMRKKGGVQIDLMNYEKIVKIYENKGKK
jgi:hypothetical protein